MRAGHLEQISIAKSGIKLTPGQENLMHFNPYRECLEEREFEYSETDKVLEMEIIKPAEA